MALMAAAAFAAGTVVAVVALAIALYAFAEPRLGRAGAAATVAATASGALVIAWMILVLALKRRPAPTSAEAALGALDRILGFVRDKPILAISAAIGAGLMSVRNPRYLGAVVRAFLDGDPPRS
jgi:hypothetical protein